MRVKSNMLNNLLLIVLIKKKIVFYNCHLTNKSIKIILNPLKDHSTDNLKIIDFLIDIGFNVAKFLINFNFIEKFPFSHRIRHLFVKD